MGCRRGRSPGDPVGWDVSGRAYLLAALLSGSGVPSVLHAAEAPDEGLLEFLGSVDSEDRAWQDYLARTDIDKVAKRSANNPTNPINSGNPPIGARAPPPSDPAAAPKPTQPGSSP
jgi:hypothetical protein